MLQGLQLLQGRYQLQQQLGRNAGRQTWLAADIKTSPAETVIVKLLAFSPQMQWEDFKLFEREAQVLKNLNHARIPRYRDYFSLDKQTGSGLGWFALVQDYIPGSSLQQLIDEGERFSETQVQQIATDILNILIYLHDLSPPVLHRDIKPSNLILAENGQVYLVDFGAVQDQGASEGVTFTVVGTTGYAPLEQFWGKAVPASDLYALGATLIHLLTGIAPAELPQNNLRIQFKDKVSINPNFVRWIEALTTPDLEQRYSNASQALEDLKANRYLNATLQKIRPPVGSKIKVWKSPTQLKIEIPGRGIKFFIELIAFAGKLILGGGAIVSHLSLLFLILFLFFGAISAFYGLFSPLGIIALVLLIMLLLPLALGVRLSKALSQEFIKLTASLKLPRFAAGKSYIFIDRDSFVLEKNLLGWCYLRQKGETSTIKNIKLISAQGVTIYTKKARYSLGHQLNESECYWLCQQLRDWLKSS
ncbi:MAG TPA: serine/threonine protein kinase [Cyanobacteria bacterium UBA11372]|nr:serine/threonine protein kinase [Cyanobacteria bacterium UBA11372]